MSFTHEPSEGNPLEIEARADELEAEALRLRAQAKRRRLALEASTTSTPALAARDLTRREYAERANVSEATVARWLNAGMPSIPVGTTVRINPAAADEWRQARGRKPTTPEPKAAVEGVDVSSLLAAGGLRVAKGGRR